VSTLQPMMVAALLVSGMGIALLGSLKVPLAKRLQIDEARVGGLVSVFGFAMIPVILLAGFLTDHLGRQGVFLGGCVLFTASLALLAGARQYTVALVAIILVSAAWSALINVGNVLTPVAFGGGDPARTAYATNLANVFFGIGAFLTPLAVAVLLRWAGFTLAVTLLGLLALVPAALGLAVDFSMLGEAAAGEVPARLGSLLADPVLWLCGLTLFFYGPLEASMAAWATTYLGDQGVSEEAAARWLSAFWLAFMASRLATALLPEFFSLPPGWETGLIVMLALACLAVLLSVVLSRGRASSVAAVVAAGLVFGPIFPTLMAVLLGQFDSALHGRAVGLLFAIGGIGWTAIPMLIGAYARRAGVQRGFTIAAGAAVGLVVVAWLLMQHKSG